MRKCIFAKRTTCRYEIVAARVLLDIIQMKHFEGFGSTDIPVCASIDAVF
jgi:hypothetical protein